MPERQNREKTVLYIEDNRANVELMEEIIHRLGNRQITLKTAFSAEQGVASIEADAPDLVLMDINLPGMDGFEAYRHLKGSPTARHIPVIALTADAFSHQVEKGLEAGFYAYLTKPLDIPNALALIDEALGN